MSSDGYILTNNHVVNDSASNTSNSSYTISDANSITVSLYNDTNAYSAKVVGLDPTTDLAVIKIDKTGLTAANIGDSSTIKIGQFVLAVGNPLGLESTVTSGIVSAVNRSVPMDDGTNYTLIQTDAAINAGNSGGALVNSEGKVIGINTLKMSGTGIEGMGFAIPINDTLSIYNQLKANGKISRPYVGISGAQVTDNLAKQYNLPVRNICAVCRKRKCCSRCQDSGW
ncbi:MAG: trypsin-like peptidase domain-containing protein [Firmicutes bacterium]|nr:trypsin-like peptidase domain-containing protein [Bacillota bacterium]